MTHNKQIWFIFGSILFVLAVTVVAVLRWGSVGVAGVVWQDPHECIPGLVNCDKQTQDRSVAYGVYDPAGDIREAPGVQVEHIFISWTYDNGAMLAQAIERTQRLQRALFVSIEPWPSETLSKDALLADVASGEYDQTITQLCGAFGALGDRAWLSWGHEMDHDLTERYPWSHRDPFEFVEAYTHFVSACRAEAPQAKYIWSPVGDKKLGPYWPGDDVVDFVGVPVYSFPEFDKEMYGGHRSFAQAFGDKYERVKVYNKPVVVVELGVSGQADYQQYWLDEMKASFNKFPLLHSVVLFSSRDTPGAWGPEYSTPDWRLQPGVVFP